MFVDVVLCICFCVFVLLLMISKDICWKIVKKLWGWRGKMVKLGLGWNVEFVRFIIFYWNYLFYVNKIFLNGNVILI